MSEPASISSGIAKRYATALFEITKEANAIPALEADVDALDAALLESGDFRDLISSPVYSRDQQSRAVGSIASKMGLGQVLSNTLQLMGSKRRLFVLPQMVTELRALIAEAKGEVSAEVVSARPLSDAQRKALATALKQNAGKDVKINASVDESLIGGLIVKLGSKMIDTSIRARLSALQNTMKEVG
ncbi:F0F1 ATP synthase subunit delta [Rhodovulum sulfidophilum]|uniref:F0F1 ATP synthase subunit delta n=1 Tax=Rhodovulum sulfidophilum TaxID=35806 RepID=UPI0005A7BE79|nr:F0F1 ATP synthase subunit delta [Rhodovulum sulfidophilum]ANB34027.1 F0F1 ATP synthase subunit delta [Rhodovulum sulfidophilum DSM 1374]ANB37849.1 F0F1 ATP synthase subunit delta [Rhodovulum sulfidophilum]MBL3560592.1 F0F1 ATP synthase subunit delta [Rhodovulum sulfidophilum]MBL3594748.1 F0F1 ATP synthase subunit delta [Rhodovulum sulfidophilum]MCW2304178.1 F-type H+-transporting ATPase subunit delta [Rhodovulum sulfidophilum]